MVAGAILVWCNSWEKPGPPGGAGFRGGNARREPVGVTPSEAPTGESAKTSKRPIPREWQEYALKLLSLDEAEFDRAKGFWRSAEGDVEGFALEIRDGMFLELQGEQEAHFVAGWILMSREELGAGGRRALVDMVLEEAPLSSWAGNWLGQYVSRNPAKRLRECIDLRNSDLGHVRLEWASIVLKSVREHPEEVDLDSTVIPLLDDSNIDVVDFAATCLEEFDPEGLDSHHHARMLAAWQGRSDWEGLSALAIAIGPHLPSMSREHRMLIIDGITREDDDRRKYALLAVRIAGGDLPRQAADAAATALASVDPSVRTSAINVLRAAGPLSEKSREALRRVWAGDADPIIREEAGEVLRRGGTGR